MKAMKRTLFFLILIFLCTGTRAQSLADKELECIVSGELTEKISHGPEDTIHYYVVVMEVATGNVVASLFYKDGEFIRNPLGNTYDAVKYVMDRLVLSRLSKSPNSSSTESQSIKQRDGWVHPADR